MRIGLTLYKLESFFLDGDIEEMMDAINYC